MIVTVRCPTCDRPIEVDDGLPQTALTCWTCRRSRRIKFEQPRARRKSVVGGRWSTAQPETLNVEL